MDRSKILEAVLKLDQAKKCIREHIDRLDKTSASDMFEAGALCEDCVLIAAVVEDLLEWREQRCPGRASNSRSAASTRPRHRSTRSTSTASSRAAS